MSSLTKNYECKEMRLARMYILENLDQRLTISQIAKYVCQSESSLKRKFKATYDSPVNQFIRYSRVMKAKDLLDTREYNVTQVALEVGYSNSSHFSNTFKKYMGCNPGDYMRKVSKLPIN